MQKLMEQSANSLWNAVGPNGLIREFGRTLLEQRRVTQFSYIESRLENGSQIWKEIDLKVPGQNSLTKAQIHVLAEQVTAIHLDDDDLDEGINVVLAGGAAYQVLLLARGQDNNRFLAWFDEGYSAESCQSIDFLSRLLVHEYRWYLRLNASQTLLNKDDLTGLYNSRFLDGAIDSEIKRCERTSSSFCLMFIDLDKFKPVNDQFGHLSGSNVLVQVAQVIRNTVREIDFPIRYGGDEFVVLLVGADSEQGARVAERLRQKIEDTRFRIEGGKTVSVTASIGVAAYPMHGKDRQQLLKLADENMYRSKRSGKNKVTVMQEI